jgi:hypothetical protein
LDFADAGAAQYDTVVEKMGLRGRLPAGALFHAAGPTDTGWRVCDVWESAELFQDFAETKIGPISSEVGMPAPTVRSFEVSELERGGGGPVTFVQIVTIPGLDAQGFRALDDEVTGPDHVLPADCVFHVNGKLGDGWCVVDYWTSKDARDAFMEANIRPVMERTELAGPPSFDDVDVHNTLRAGNVSPV